MPVPNPFGTAIPASVPVWARQVWRKEQGGEQRMQGAGAGRLAGSVCVGETGTYRYSYMDNMVVRRVYRYSSWQGLYAVISATGSRFWGCHRAICPHTCYPQHVGLALRSSNCAACAVLPSPVQCPHHTSWSWHKELRAQCSRKDVLAQLRDPIKGWRIISLFYCI